MRMLQRDYPSPFIFLINNDLDSERAIKNTIYYIPLRKLEKEGIIYSSPSTGRYFYARNLNETQFAKQHLFKDGKYNGGGMWHPGPYGHHLWGSYLSWHVMGLMEESLLQLEETLKELKMLNPILSIQNLKLDWIQKEFGHSEKEIDCKMDDPDYESLFCGSSLKCYTSMLPHFGHEFGIENLLLGFDQNDGNKEKNEVSSLNLIHNESFMHGKYYPPINWTYMLFPGDLQAYKLNQVWKSQMRDEKWIWAGNREDGSITFHLTTTNLGPLQICQCRVIAGRFYPALFVTIQDGSRIWLDDKVIYEAQNIEEQDKIGIRGKILPKFKICQEFAKDVPPGRHKLTIEPLVSQRRVHIAYILHT